MSMSRWVASAAAVAIAVVVVAGCGSGGSTDGGGEADLPQCGQVR
jgi:hypothetical protein